MPPPIPVQLLPHDSGWAAQATAEAARFVACLGPVLIEVHHVGSTAIADIKAKPILDLLPVTADLDALDASRATVEALGYIWWGEYGLAGRRYCTRDDPETGRRLVQLHCYAVGSPEIDRHVAFRDYLCAHPGIARDYERVKLRCAARYPGDSHAYTECKSAWIKRVETDALRWRANCVCPRAPRRVSSTVIGRVSETRAAAGFDDLAGNPACIL